MAGSFSPKRIPPWSSTSTASSSSKPSQASPDSDDAAHSDVREELAGAMDGGKDIDLDFTNTSYLDLSGSSWEFFLQDIVRRSKTLTYISVVTSFTCSKMRPDS